MAETAAIVIIGNEILTGKFPEENGVWLTGQLRQLGVELRRILVIPDELEDIANAVRTCADRFDYVFTSGGIGPTHDDVTIAGIAQAFAVPVDIHPQLLQQIVKHCGPDMPEANRRLAEIPRGAELVYTENASWPLRRYRNIYILPGVPSLFRTKFAAIREQFRGPAIHEQRIYCNAQEGTLAGPLNRICEAYPTIRIGSYPRYGEPDYRVVLTLEHTDATLLGEATSQLREALGDLVVSVSR